MRLLALFLYLQALDLLTTLAFLLNGVEEANPLMRLALAAGSTPLEGLLGVKLAAVVLAAFCWKTGRMRVLLGASVFFAALVVWNLVALILRSPALL